MKSNEEPSDSNDPYTRQLDTFPRLVPEVMARVIALRPQAATCVRSITVATAILLSIAHVLAQTPDPQPPGYVSNPARPALNPFPAEQDWSFLARRRSIRTSLIRQKYIRLGDDPRRYISFGLEYRTEYEYYDNWMLDAGPQEHNGYVFSRVCRISICIPVRISASSPNGSSTMSQAEWGAGQM